MCPMGVIQALVILVVGGGVGILIGQNNPRIAAAVKKLGKTVDDEVRAEMAKHPEVAAMIKRVSSKLQ